MSRRQKIEEMLAREPDDPFLNFGLAMELAKEGETERAISQFDRVLELDPNYDGAYFHKANTLIALERRDAARSVLKEGIEAAKRVGNAHAEEEMRGLLTSIES